MSDIIYDYLFRFYQVVQTSQIRTSIRCFETVLGLVLLGGGISILLFHKKRQKDML